MTGRAGPGWQDRAGGGPASGGRSGLCPGQGGVCRREGDVERPRGAARGRAGRRRRRAEARAARSRERRRTDGAGARPLAAPPQVGPRSTPGAGAAGAAQHGQQGSPRRGRTAGPRWPPGPSRDAGGAVAPHPPRLGRGDSGARRLWVRLRRGRALSAGGGRAGKRIRNSHLPVPPALFPACLICRSHSPGGSGEAGRSLPSFDIKKRGAGAGPAVTTGWKWRPRGPLWPSPLLLLLEAAGRHGAPEW